VNDLPLLGTVAVECLLKIVQTCGAGSDDVGVDGIRCCDYDNSCMKYGNCNGNDDKNDN
jgi:hypothetical protein